MNTSETILKIRQVRALLEELHPLGIHSCDGEHVNVTLDTFKQLSEGGSVRAEMTHNGPYIYASNYDLNFVCVL